MNDAIIIMQLLFANRTIPAEYNDHFLAGSEWDGAKELHIGGDFLLIYRIDEKQNLITFVDIGSHSELFG